jgi:hypothetical protein
MSVNHKTTINNNKEFKRDQSNSFDVLQDEVTIIKFTSGLGAKSAQIKKEIVQQRLPREERKSLVDFKHPSVRPEICKFFQKDKCKNPNCTYYHPDPNKPCREYKFGKCKYGQYCLFYHGNKEKTKIEVESKNSDKNNTNNKSFTQEAMENPKKADIEPLSLSKATTTNNENSSPDIHATNLKQTSLKPWTKGKKWGDSDSDDG